MADAARSLDGLHIALLTASASRLGGGVATAVQGHASLIRRAGGRVTVIALEDAHSLEDYPYAAGMATPFFAVQQRFATLPRRPDWPPTNTGAYRRRRTAPFRLARLVPWRRDQKVEPD